MNYLLVFAIFFGNLAILVASGWTNGSPAMSANISATPTPLLTPIPKKVGCTVQNPKYIPPAPRTREINSGNLRAMAMRMDWDCDGVSNHDDNCLNTFNPSQIDRNKNKIGDVCETRATFPKNKNCVMPVSKPTRSEARVDDPGRGFTADDAKMLAKRMDNDCDGVSNWDDNCRFVYNPKQTDRNKNKIGDACEARKTKRKRSKT